MAIEKTPNVPPFVSYCAQLIPTVFDNSLSYYEALSALAKWMQDNLVDVINNNAAVTEEYIRLTEELKAFVENYFDNLDVQEEINNKLDQMTEDGTLQEIITTYIQSNVTWTFDTVAEMVTATNLTDGSYAKTMGKYSANDGFGAKYKISTTGEIALSNGLYASVVEDFGGNNYYDEITYTTTRLNDTTVYITTIPPKDSSNNNIKLTVDSANKTPSDYAQENLTSLTMNGLAYVDDAHERGSVISNGAIVRNVNTSDIPDCYYYLGIMPDGTLRSFKANETTASDMLNAGCEQAFMCYWLLIVNNVEADFTTIASQLIDGSDVVLKPQPRQAIGQKSDGTIIIVTTDGRNAYDTGLTSSELADIMSDLGCVNAWNLDGGGSTTTVIKGFKINKSIDNDGTTERVRNFLINVKKQTIDEELGKSYSNTGFAVNASYNKLLPLINQSVISEIDATSPDSLSDKQCIKLSNHTPSAPSEFASLYIFNYPHPRAEFRDKYALQIGYNRDDNRAFTRRKVNEAYTEWQPIMGYYHSLYSTLTFTGTADQTYEEIAFDNTFSNIENGITKINEDANYKEFQVKCNSEARFEVSFTVTCNANVTGGTKYAKIMIDNDDIGHLVAITEVATGKQATFGCTGIIPYSLVNRTLTLKVYGATGDRWRRCQIRLKQVK